MRRRDVLAAGPLFLASCRGVAGAGERPPLPAMLMARVPPGSRQVVLVMAPRARSVAARLWWLERDGAAGDWHPRTGPVPVVVGRHGLAWGCSGLTPATPPADGRVWRVKREGDGCAPAGVFRLPFAFGRAAVWEASWVRLPYVQATATLRGVDDPGSRFYNQVVDETRLPGGAVKDWTSSEDMRRADGLYDWGIFVGHNHPQPVGGPDARGSCIFLHCWQGPDAGTAGCTAMSAASLRRLLHWLDPAADPVLVQTTEA